MNFDLYFMTYTKINSGWTRDLNAKGKTIKFVEGNRKIGALYDLGLDKKNFFFYF